jgi:hypothetical protein
MVASGIAVGVTECEPHCQSGSGSREPDDGGDERDESRSEGESEEERARSQEAAEKRAKGLCVKLSGKEEEAWGVSPSYIHDRKTKFDKFEFSFEHLLTPEHFLPMKAGSYRYYRQQLVSMRAGE